MIEFKEKSIVYHPLSVSERGTGGEVIIEKIQPVFYLCDDRINLFRFVIPVVINPVFWIPIKRIGFSSHNIHSLFLYILSQAKQSFFTIFCE